MPMNQQAIQTWRNDLKKQQTALEQTFVASKNAKRLLTTHTQIVDQLLKKIWQAANVDKALCLIAVGGYGRKELFPYSDIDLLILLPAVIDESQSAKVQALISALWDIGLNVGHSVRNLQECATEAHQDITVQTNLNEARLIVGKKVNFTAFLNVISQQLNPSLFLEAKIQEQKNRHAKLDGTAYNLEPNIKESPGGLRDLHSIIWIAQSQNLGQTWHSLKENGVITATELRHIRHHERILQKLRIRLHYLSKRREDRLIFDFQNELAEKLGLKNTNKKRASEQLMQSYYRSVKYISLINELLLKLLTQNLAPTEASIAVNERFISHHNFLEAENVNLFKQQPSAILECFLLLQQQPTLKGLGPRLLRQLQSAKKLVSREFRQSKKHKKMFLNILSEKNGVHHSLRRMNRYGILGQYIPAFGRIIGQMQHDLFHVYTVDEHTLNVLANLRRFSKPELQHEFPLCSDLFDRFGKPHLLYIAALFHDIAKGRGGDHSVLGCIDAKRFCKAHQLPKKDTALVTWLVAAHLHLSKTAQKTDLSDPNVIKQFAHYVKDETHLTALYLLTVADIRGTSPKVWNDWKANLLEKLFFETRSALRNNSFSVAEVIALRQQEAAEKLNNYGLQPESYNAFWQLAGDHYFTRYTSDEIAWQTRLLIPHALTDTPIIRARLSADGDGIQMMTYLKDQDDIFARICNFFDRISYNIGHATVYTTHHDYALNTFIILDQSVKSVTYSNLLDFIENDLLEKIQSNVPLASPLKGRINRQIKHMPIKTKVDINVDTNKSFHTVEIVTSDTPGLLASIAFIFLKHGTDLHYAKVNTLGNRAEDSFIISGRQEKRLSKKKLAQLEQDLLDL